MVVITRWHIILVAAVILFLSLAQVAHQNQYDADVLRIVSSTINKGAAQSSSAPSLGPTTIERTVTVTATATQTVAGPTVTETEVVKEKEDCDERKAMWDPPFTVFNTTFEVPANIKYDPKGPRPDQIVLLTATDGKGHNEAIKDAVKLAKENRKAYAEYHGYIDHFINITKYDIPDIHPVWKKLPAIVESFNTFPEAQWVFWLDLDAIIMTPTVAVEKTILSKEGMRKSLHGGAQLMVGSSEEKLDFWWPQEPDFENIDLIMAQDGATFNAGSFLIRRSLFSQWLLDIWADPFFMHAGFTNREQDSMVHMMKHHPTVRKHTGVARQRSINAFSEGPNWMEWQKGDLLVHFAGCWVYNNCQERWTKYWDLKEQVPPK
ncbi:hypothetical protein AMS68_006129 [Peltaster fructicola]|uniref:Glycosyltransferase family 34 protein n=1 Tax=Peltaster fructicola TaxID=286661 RepID=A0A6H0Y0Q3_9PEZI|nr:hypothetical protein AMS68_006129 [Peltaster fructicola]